MNLPTAPPPLSQPRDSPPWNTSMVSMSQVQSDPPSFHDTPPQALPQPLMELSRALYLLHTGKLVRMLEVLIHANYDNLFNHFTDELLVDPTWAETEGGYNYFYMSNRNYNISWILEKEADRFTIQAHRLIHPDIQIRDISPYQ